MTPIAHTIQCRPQVADSPKRQRGFTLVEMLVAVTLVLLIMSLFAQIFQMAAGSIAAQQGIAENDQQARMVSGLIRGDLQRRSMRIVMPFQSDQDTRELDLDLLRDRQGYFYYSENNPFDETDDVLQFTVLVNARAATDDGSPYLGKADSGLPATMNTMANLSRVVISGIDTSGPAPIFTLSDSSSLSKGNKVWVTGSLNGINDGLYEILTNNTMSGEVAVSPTIPDATLTGAQLGFLSLATEPEFDDGLPGNSLGASSAAEVCYFLRNGNLCRRIMLIRQASTIDEAQPHYVSGGRVISGNYNGRFWHDFDYSAFHFPGKITGAGTVGRGVMFHGTGFSLYNGSDSPTLVLDDSVSPLRTFPFSLGVPNFRFGFDRDSGLPREHLSSGVFFGRYLLQETSHANFGYPGFMPAVNPFSPSTTLNHATNSNLIDGYSNTIERRGEEIVLPNCLAFDVKVFDPNTNLFADLGNSTEDANGNGSLDAGEDTNGNGTLDIGVFHSSRVRNPEYSSSNRYKFDTWHPKAVVGTNPATSVNPPFLPEDSAGHPVALTAIQIRIVYQSRTDGRVRQVTIVQSLQDGPLHEHH